MNPTKIEWCDYTVNSVKGYCPVGCPYCYAHSLYDRFHWDKTIRYHDSVWDDVRRIPQGSKIFVGSTIELFGDWIEPEWLQLIFDHCRACPQLTFIFLTKKPENLAHWNPWPENVWVGATVTDESSMLKACSLLHVRAKVKFISFEPLLGQIRGLWSKGDKATTDTFVPDWVILGALTGIGSKNQQPKREWIDDIEQVADEVGIAVFEKDSLTKILNRPLRREWPTPIPCANFTSRKVGIPGLRDVTRPEPHAGMA